MSTYIVNLKMAWKLFDDQTTASSNSYFQILDYMPEENDFSSLDDDTKMFLALNWKDGTPLQSFFSRELVYDIQEVDMPDGIIKFLTFDGVWYGIARNPLQDEDGRIDVDSI